MTGRIIGFIWQQNLEHLQDRHPDVDPWDLEDAVAAASRWLRAGRDDLGQDVWYVRWGRRAVLFNYIDGWVRIFSVQKWW